MNTYDSNAATRAASTEHNYVSGTRLRRLFMLVGLVTLLGIVFVSIATTPVNAQAPNPPNEPRRGIIYDDLRPSDRAKCKGGYDVLLGNGQRPLCAVGPDPVPADLNGESAVIVPVGEHVATPVTCDGDGVSGKRYQVMYVHADDVPDQYATYVNSIQQWVSEADAILDASAALTGGTRHFRFVHDANCLPVVQDITVAAANDDTFGKLITELRNRGYQDPNRNYVLFVDSPIYCGISTIFSDDSMWSTNWLNTGAFFARIDTRCWRSSIVAHEMMHTLGAVQLSAPHTSGHWHCTDGYDLMCYQDSATTVLQWLCDSSQSALFDCNKDDYFNTNPAPGSYLATHWDTAFSQFLIYPHGQVLVQTMLTGKVDAKGNFQVSDVFKPRTTVSYQVVLQDANGAGLQTVRVTVNVIQPDGLVRCTYTGLSDATGMISSSCALPKDALRGEWQVSVTKAEKPGSDFVADANSIHSFHVGNR